MQAMCWCGTAFGFDCVDLAIFFADSKNGLSEDVITAYAFVGVMIS